MNKILQINNLLWIALALALIGSLNHLASIFASIDGNVPMGWIQALAVDIGLFALAYSIKARKVAKRGTKWIWLGLAIFTLISIYGNYAYGLFATSGKLPPWIVATKPIILAATLPILVLYLAEIQSDNRQYDQQMEQKAAKKAARLPKLPPDLATANQVRADNKAVKVEELAGILATEPDQTNTQLASRLGVSRATIRNYRKELNGQVAQ